MNWRHFTPKLKRILDLEKFDQKVKRLTFGYVNKEASIPKEAAKLLKRRQFKNFNAIDFQNDLLKLI